MKVCILHVFADFPRDHADPVRIKVFVPLATWLILSFHIVFRGILYWLHAIILSDNWGVAIQVIYTNHEISNLNRTTTQWLGRDGYIPRVRTKGSIYTLGQSLDTISIYLFISHLYSNNERLNLMSNMDIKYAYWSVSAILTWGLRYNEGVRKNSLIRLSIARDGFARGTLSIIHCKRKRMVCLSAIKNYYLSTCHLWKVGPDLESSCPSVSVLPFDQRRVEWRRQPGLRSYPKVF